MLHRQNNNVSPYNKVLIAFEIKYYEDSIQNCVTIMYIHMSITFDVQQVSSIGQIKNPKYSETKHFFVH